MNTHRLRVAGSNMVEVSVTEQGEGHPVLLLHGGGGPQTVREFAELLATKRPAHVITPTHPGFGGTPRSDALARVPDLAALYVALLADLGLRDVTVIGNSIGGWIAAEMALADTERISSFVLVDAVGIVVPGHPIADFFSLSPRQVAELSYRDPDRFGLDPSKLSPEALQVMAGNRATLNVYAGTSMADAALAARLAGVRTPTLVVWGDSDRIADADYGRAFAGAIPGAQFQLLTGSGHLPQIETPEALADLVWAFAQEHVSMRPTG
jgi:pimeloyl-ACP methyl ester carboxylesterase